MTLPALVFILGLMVWGCGVAIAVLVVALLKVIGRLERVELMTRDERPPGKILAWGGKFIDTPDTI